LIICKYLKYYIIPEDVFLIYYEVFQKTLFVSIRVVIWGKMASFNKEFRNLYSSPNIVNTVKSEVAGTSIKI
jgi:hypothetical protein